MALFSGAASLALKTFFSALIGKVFDYLRGLQQRREDRQAGADAATNAGRDDTLRRAVRRNEIDADVRDDSDDELDDRLRRPERRNNAGAE